MTKLTQAAPVPLAIDLYCGLGGWTEGLLDEGYRVVGFDCEQHVYGEARYPAQLVIQDVLTLHGRQFKDAALIVASPPCQAYSYRAMPWKRAKALPPPDNSLFEACFRLQDEACAAAGRFIPLVVENVCGAQKWVGRARWHYGSFYLWGDVPALMPVVRKAHKFNPDGTAHGVGSWFAIADSKNRGACVKAKKNDGGSWFAVAHNTTSGHGQNPDGRLNTIANAQDGRKQKGSGPAWFRDEIGSMSGQSSARKAASAHIAKIPYELSRHIGRAWWPSQIERTA
jgi:C-5 cytosine-specific DNA methylase